MIGAARVSDIIPARNEASTVASVVGPLRAQLMDAAPVIDELVVMDSLSTDDTATQAADAGATVFSVADVRPDLGVQAGKGEALWKALFVTSGTLLVFVDADLREWGVHFVTDLLRPLLADPHTNLVKGFYDRVSDGDGDRPQGGRVTELVARPLIALRWPDLRHIVQPLAGEWAVRRSLFESIAVPVGYGVELGTLLSAYTDHGVASIAQVDLGRRAHRHHGVHDLGLMAAELLALADRRSGVADVRKASLRQFDRTTPSGFVDREVPLAERPPAVTVPRYLSPD